MGLGFPHPRLESYASVALRCHTLTEFAARRTIKYEGRLAQLVRALA